MATEEDSAAELFHLPETLTSSSSTSSSSSLPLIDQDRLMEYTSSSASPISLSSPPLDHPPVAAAPSPPRPSLPKSFSYSKLNAKAPEFIPRTSSASSLLGTSPASTVTSPGPITVAGTTKQASFVIPQPPGPPTLVHVFATTRPAPAPSPAAAGATTLFTTHLPPVQGTYASAAAYQLPAVQYNTPPYFGGVGGYIASDQQQDLLTTVALAPQPLTAAAVAALTAPPVGDLDQGNGVAGGAATSISKSRLPDDVSQKILNQVEYYFSDLNLATTDHLIRFMNKDPEGYVPISVVASFKKIKAVISNHSQLANILRSSEKLVVSEDGKKVKRVHRLTELDMEELQSRIVIAENLPEDHCHQTLMKTFSAVGSVKTIRTCQPQFSNGGASAGCRTSKSDGMLFSNKLHAFVEYESIELAEKAVTELNDENDWRNGLKVRLLLRPKAKSSQGRLKKAHENENDAFSPEESDAHSNDHDGEDDKEGEQKKARYGVWGKGRGRPQYQPPISRGSITGLSPPSNILANNEQLITSKQLSVPRMPDGTKGFCMGRGKPVAVKSA